MGGQGYVWAFSGKAPPETPWTWTHVRRSGRTSRSRGPRSARHTAATAAAAAAAAAATTTT
eukprot:14399447-Heterocapsa_arctica.AAC.1